jgi:hypothetical protein
VRIVVRVAFTIVLVAVAAWWALALRFRLPGPDWLATAIAAGYALGVAVVLLRLRPFRRAALVVLASFGVLALWWSTIRPSNDRDWAPEYARIPYGELHGDLLTLHNVRDFDYRSETEFTARWETRTYDLSSLTGLDLFLSYWGSPAIAHTLVAWTFADGPPLAVSIETRRERSEGYSAIRGFFRQYEICYVAADERDLIRLRTNYRGEDVYLYRLRTPTDRARALLLDYVSTMNALRDHPEWYNAFSDNCTTSIRTHTKAVGGVAPRARGGGAPRARHGRGRLRRRRLEAARDRLRRPDALRARGRRHAAAVPGAEDAELDRCPGARRRSGSGVLGAYPRGRARR